jgi:hypothetical protein
MAMLPQSARTAAAYLGGGVARGIEQQGSKIAEAGKQVASQAKSGIGEKVGNFLGNLGSQVQQAGAAVGTQGAIGKRDVGLATVGVGLTGAFVGGMGANAGVNQLMGYFQSDPRTRVANEPPAVRGNKMPSDLQQSYLNLAVPGSPLGQMNFMQTPNIKEAQMRQRLLRAAMGPEFIEPEST